jgi:hypothetical protein
VLHANRRFYRLPIPLSEKEWCERRFAPAEFLDENGNPFNPAEHTGSVSFQLAPGGDLGDTPATLWLHSVSLLTENPETRLWQSGLAFDDVDVDNLRAGHSPLPPPPAASAREPLVRFTGPEPDLLANWDGKDTGAESPRPPVRIERVTPAPPAAPFLRITLAAGVAAWGNANIPLPAAKLRGQDGLALRLRGLPADADISLALHAMTRGGPVFYRTDAESSEAWADAILPWSEFRSDDGQAFAPASDTPVNLQLCRPHGTLAKDAVIELETIDAFTR